MEKETIISWQEIIDFIHKGMKKKLNENNVDGASPYDKVFNYCYQYIMNELRCKDDISGISETDKSGS